MQPNTSATFIGLPDGRVNCFFYNRDTQLQSYHIAANYEAATAKRKEWEDAGCPDTSVAGDVNELRERHNTRFPVSDAQNGSDPNDLYRHHNIVTTDQSF